MKKTINSDDLVRYLTEAILNYKEKLGNEKSIRNKLRIEGAIAVCQNLINKIGKE